MSPGYVEQWLAAFARIYNLTFTEVSMGTKKKKTLVVGCSWYIAAFRVVECVVF